MRPAASCTMTDRDQIRVRLDDGTYGVCEACGRLIGEERLAADPLARFCVEDQGMAEQNRGQGSGASGKDVLPTERSAPGGASAE